MHRYAGGTLGNVEQTPRNSLYTSIFVMRRCAEGTLGHVEKNAGIPCTNKYILCIAMPRAPSAMLKNQWKSHQQINIVMHRYAEGTLANADTTMAFVAKTNLNILVLIIHLVKLFEMFFFQKVDLMPEY